MRFVLGMTSALFSLAGLAAELDAKLPEQPSEEEKGLSIVINDWPPGNLRTLGEVLLSPLAKDRNAETYRLTVRPSFSPPMAVRLTNKGDHYEITRRGGTGEGHFDPDQPPSNFTAEIGSEQGAEFRKLFEAVAFSKQTTNENYHGFDGSEYILEAVSDGKYHAILRWSPDADTQNRNLLSFVACCQWLKDHAPKEQAAKK